MADKKTTKKRAIVEEVSAEPTEAPKTSIETDHEKSGLEPSQALKGDPLKKVEAPTPPPGPMKDNKVSLKLVVFITAFVAVIVGGLVGGVIVFVNGTKNNDASASPTPDPALASPTVEATPSPVPVDKKKYTVDIQNGSGIGGQGAAVQKILTDAGFKVGTVGNAKTFDYTKTLVQVKSSVSKDYIATLEGALTKNYVLDKTAELPDTSKSEVVIIVGSEKAK